MSLRRQRVFEIVEPARADDRASHAFDVMIVLLILINIAALMVQTLPEMEGRHARLFWWIEAVCVWVFTLEYALRMWSVVELREYAHPVKGRLRYAARPMLIVDLLAVVPWYLPLLGLDLRFLRALRLMWVFRVLKITRYSQSLQTMSLVLKEKRDELLVTLSGLAVLLMVASCLMYYAEHEAQPEVFSSIPAAMWWAVITVTTVGYGDVVPITVVGRIIAAGIAILGIGLFALPAGILASGFTTHLHDIKRKPKA